VAGKSSSRLDGIVTQVTGGSDEHQTHSDFSHGVHLDCRLASHRGFAQQNSDAAKTSIQHAATENDGRHDFDFEIGTWKIHLKRLDAGLTGSTNWVEFDGTSVTRKVDGAPIWKSLKPTAGGGHIERSDLTSIRSPNHQWSLYWATKQERGPWGRHDRRIQEWTRGVFRHGTVRPKWSIHLVSICLVGDHAEFGTLLSSPSPMMEQDLGSELDYGSDTGAR